MYFLVANIMMDGFNMRRADGTAAIAFEMPGTMQDSEARWTAVTQLSYISSCNVYNVLIYRYLILLCTLCTWGGEARARPATFEDV